MNRDAPIFYVKVSPKGARGDPQERVDVSGRILGFGFEDDEKKADVLKLSVDNFDLTQIDGPHWRKGQVLIAAWGYVGAMTPERECVIKKVSGSNPLTIEAHAKSVLMDREIRSRTWDNKTRSEVVKEIAEANGYLGDRVHIQATEVKYESITQARLSDAQFLRHLANKEGFEFFVDFDGLHWHERKLGQRPVKTLTYYIDPGKGDIQKWSIDGDITKRPSSVKLRGRDPLRKATFEAKADNQSTSNRDTLGDTLEVIDAQTGASLGDRSINTSHDETLPTSEASKEGAERAAAGRYKRAQANTIKLTVEIIGDPDLVAKSVIQVNGIGETLSGRYYISSISNDVQSGGFLQKLRLKRDASSSSASGGGVAAAGKKNAQPAKQNGGDPVPVEVIDPVTGKSRGTRYVDNKGRE